MYTAKTDRLHRTMVSLLAAVMIIVQLQLPPMTVGAAEIPAADGIPGEVIPTDIQTNPDSVGIPDENNSGLPNGDPDVPGAGDDSRQAPDVPQDPQQTDVPQDPQQTDVPQDPQQTDVPQDPQLTDVPQDPQQTDVPQAPQQSDVPQDPQQSDVPQDPQQTDVPQDPQQNDVPQDPQDPTGGGKEDPLKDQPKDAKGVPADNLQKGSGKAAGDGQTGDSEKQGGDSEKQGADEPRKDGGDAAAMHDQPEEEKDFAGAMMLLGAPLLGAPASVETWNDLAAAISGAASGATIYLGGSFPAIGTITIDKRITIAAEGGGYTIYSSENGNAGEDKKYDSMFIVEKDGDLTIEKGVTLSGRTDLSDPGQGCPDNAVYTADSFTGDTDNDTYDPRGFFIQVETGGKATLNGTVSDFVTSRDKATTPRYVAPVVAKGNGAVFNVGPDGVIKNNLVGYIVNDEMANNDAQTIKQYVKGAGPNIPRVPNAATQKKNSSKFDGRPRSTDAGIDGGVPGSGITATAGAVIYKGGASGTVEGLIQNNRADTGGIMVSGSGTKVTVTRDALIEKNVGVQFGGGSTAEQGGTILMTGGKMYRNVAWFGGGAVYATENGVDWLQGRMEEADFTPQFDKRADGEFLMEGGELTENTAFTRGGAVLADSDGVYINKGILSYNMSRMLGGAMYVMGDHPKYEYTVVMTGLYVHDNAAVSGESVARNRVAEKKAPTGIILGHWETDGEISWDDLNAPMQTLLSAPKPCSDAPDNILDENKSVTGGKGGGNTDDYMDGTGAQGTGGGVWLCAYGNTVFAANKTYEVVINNNWATGAPELGKNAYHKAMIGNDRLDAINNSQESRVSRSGVSGGSDFHADTGGSGSVTISGLEPASGHDWHDENTGNKYLSETSGGRLNLVNKANVVMDPADCNVEVFGNLARHGGGLAADGTFIFGSPTDRATPAAVMEVKKEWTHSAKKSPVTIRVTAKVGNHDVVLADVPLDGTANLPLTEFDTVQELEPSGNTWTGSFEFPRTAEVIDDDGKTVGQARLYTLVYAGTERIPTGAGWYLEPDMEMNPADARGKTALGAVLKNGREDDIKVLFGEPVLDPDPSNPRKVAKDQNGGYQYTPISVSFSEWKEDPAGSGNLIKNDDYIFIPGQLDLVNLQYRTYATPHYKTEYDSATGNIVPSADVLYNVYVLNIPLNAPMSNDTKPIAEKYVNRDVHDDIVNFDQEFTYDILAYVPAEAAEFTISDTLAQGLEFADKNGNASTAARDVIQSVSIKTANNHRTGEGGTVSLNGEPGMNGNPINLMNAYANVNGRRVNFSTNAGITNDGRTLEVTISDDETLSIVRGKWVQVTFHARIEDKYRNLEALKALDADVDGKTKSWEDGNTDKKGSPAEKVYVSANGDLVLLASLQREVGPDPVIWAVEAPSRLFARTQSGNYYATPFDDKSGTEWRILDPYNDDKNPSGFGKPVWNNADNRYYGRPPESNNTGPQIPLTGDSRLTALQAFPEIVGSTIEKAAEGGSRLFALVKDADGEHYYATPDGDKTGGTWTELTDKESDAYKNAEGRLSNDRYTVRMLDTTTGTIELDPAKMKNWPVISDESHEGMANQSNYRVKLRDGAKSDHKTNTVTVAPETAKIIVRKIWSTGDGGRWPEGISSVTFRILAVDGSGAEKKVYADADGRVTGVGSAPDGAAEFTVTLTKDEAEKTVAGLPKLKDTTYIAREMLINDVPVSFGDGAPAAKTAVGDLEIFTTMEASERKEGEDSVPVFTAVNSTITEEKYVENKVHANLECFDEEFTYSVMGFVPAGATKVILSDELTEDLLFVGDSVSNVLSSVAAYTENDHQGTGSGTVSLTSGDTFIASYPEIASGSRQSDLGKEDRDYGIELEGKTVRLTLEEDFLNEVRSHEKLAGRDDRSFWIKMTFRAKINPDSYAEVAAKIQTGDDSTVEKGIRWEKVPEDGPVLNGKDVLDDGSHAGLANRAKYQVFFGNEGTSEHETNTVTVKPKTQDLSVTKVWVGAAEDEILTPEEFRSYLILKAGDRDVTEEYADCLTVTRNNDGTYAAKWTGLPKLTGVTYGVDEESIPGYSKEISGTTITNTRTEEELEDLVITKVWAGAEESDIPAPEEFKKYLVLKAGKRDVTEDHADKLAVTINRDGTYRARWTGLPKLDGEKYSADEKDVPGFTKEVKGTTITNTKIREETTELTITKIWAGAPKDEILTPEEFRGYLILKAGSEDVTKQYADKLTVTKNGDGTYTAKWAGLPKVKGVKYTADEKDVPGFKKTVRGNTITNTWEEEEEPKKEDGGKKTTIRYEDEYTVHVNGSKTWIDEGHQSGLRPKAITIHLLADGVEVNRVTMTPMHNGTTNSATWAFDFGELPMYKQGARITYTITEDPVEEYVASVSSTYDRIRTEPGGTLNFELVNKTTRNPDRLGAARGTGDESRAALYLLLLIAAGAGLAAWTIRHRRRR